jgi:hypothetical protein
MANILVLANETIGGAPLLNKIRDRAAKGDAIFYIVVPKTKPKYGNVIYDDAVRSSARVRVDLALSFAQAEGFEAHGEVGDEDPYNAAMDAIDEYDIDEIILSTHPSNSSSWVRRDLPERLAAESGLPVDHVVVDIANEGLPFDVTLVLANQTVAGELVERLEALAAEGPRRFIVIVPQDSGEGGAYTAAKRRLRQLLKSLDADGVVAAGMIGDPDPYTATMNAVSYFYISEIVVSTLPGATSKWIESGLIDRIKRATGKPVIHVESTADQASTAGKA